MSDQATSYVTPPAKGEMPLSFDACAELSARMLSEERSTTGTHADLAPFHREPG